MGRTKEYSFVLCTMPRLHARSRLLELDVLTKKCGKLHDVAYMYCNDTSVTGQLIFCKGEFLRKYELFWIKIEKQKILE